MKHRMTNQMQLFLAWTVQQDNQQHINASDAELEELYGTPKHRHRPNVDWDRFERFLPKGTQR